MNKKYNIEEVKGLMNWIQINKGITDEMDRTIILADVVYRMLYNVSLERYLLSGGENMIKVGDDYFHILPPNSVYKTHELQIETKDDEYKVFHINGHYDKSEVAVEYGMIGFMKFYMAKSEETKTNSDILEIFKKYISLVSEATVEEEPKKYTAEEVEAMSDEKLEALAGIIKTDGKTKTIINGKEVEVKIVDAPTREEIEAENKEDEDPSFNNLENQVNKEKDFAEEVKNTVAEFAKSPESSLIPEGAKLKEEKKEEKPVSTFGKNGKPTVALKKAGDKGVLNKKPDFSKATLTASADTPSPIEGIPAMFALNDVAKDAHNLRGGSVKLSKGEDGKMYAEPMKADDMKRINDTIFPKEAYTHNTATGEPLGTPFGDEIMRVFNTSAGEPKVETTPNVVDFTKVDGEEGIIKEDIGHLWYIDRANKKLIPFIKEYGKPTYDNNYEAFVLANPDILFVGNGEVSKMDENSLSEEEGQLIYDILYDIVNSPNKPENKMYNDDFMESASEWVNSIYDDGHAEEIEDDGLDEFREEE